MKGRTDAAATVLRGLGELATLQSALRARRAADEARAAEVATREAASRRERDLFADSVGVVVPLRRAPVLPPQRPRPEPIARQRALDERAALAESIADAFDVESLLETDDQLSFRRRGIGADVVRKLRRGVWVLQAELDLHGLRRDEARDRLAEFVRLKARAGVRCVRIIHGKGHGSPGREPVLKGKVRGWLVQRSEVAAFTQARAADGGAGALVVLLRAPPKE